MEPFSGKAEQKGHCSGRQKGMQDKVPEASHDCVALEDHCTDMTVLSMAFMVRLKDDERKRGKYHGYDKDGHESHDPS